MKMRMTRAVRRSVVLAGAVALFAGCENKGPAEQAGANVDKGLRNVKDAVSPPGPGEKVGRALDGK